MDALIDNLLMQLSQCQLFRKPRRKLKKWIPNPLLRGLVVFLLNFIVVVPAIALIGLLVRFFKEMV